ncbi:holo-ACP synthase [Helicobacter aurati]|nr:holo-ACP synthase [Helicobacter aurati]
MNLEIGTDITSIDRMSKVLKRQGFSFLQRFLLPSEIIMIHKRLDSHKSFILHDNTHRTSLKTFSRQDLDCYQNKTAAILESLETNFCIAEYRVSSITAYWSLKEALSKAFGVGIGSLVSFHDICIYKDSLGKPNVALHKECKKNLESHYSYTIQKISVSISHDNGFAIAVCAVTLA